MYEMPEIMYQMVISCSHFQFIRIYPPLGIRTKKYRICNLSHRIGIAGIEDVVDGSQINHDSGIIGRVVKAKLAFKFWYYGRKMQKIWE